MSVGLVSFERRVLQCFENLAVQRQNRVAEEHRVLQNLQGWLECTARLSRTSRYYQATVRDAVRAQQVAAYHAAVARRYVLAILQMQEEGYERL